MSKKRIHMVAHTHWDREWYFTIEDSNILLGENMVQVMDVLESDPEFKSYSFDAQASLVEEFLKIFPEERERLAKLIREKRIFVGPWYTQCDTLLVNKESIIRNLLYGKKICESFGHSMNLGYIPDVFGQNAYLPSIFQDFKIDYAMLKRGVYIDELKGNSNFLWKSPNGKSIKSNFMVAGYSTGEHLQDDLEHIEKEFIPMCDKIDATNKDSNEILFFVGGDQNAIKPNLPQMIKNINRDQDKYELIFSDFEKFMEMSWEKNFENTLYGELRGTGKQRIHRTIGSTRYDIKQLNSQVENRILQILEPLAVMAETAGVPYPQAWLDVMWKLLFDVHAHDSMGCCNSDATNDEVLNRVTKVKKMCDGLINLLKKKITYAVSEKIGSDNIFLIFNTDIKESSDSKEVTLFTKSKNFTIKTVQGEIKSSSVLDQKYISGGKRIVLTDKGDVEEEVPGYYRSRVLIRDNVQPMGWKTYLVEEVLGEIENRISLENSIKNSHLEIIFNNGKIDLVSKRKRTEDIIQFENVGDFGDTYDFSPLREDTPIIIDNFHLLKTEKTPGFERMEFVSEAVLPKDLDARIAKSFTENFKIFTSVELRLEEKFIRISHKIDNNCKDHRVRAILKTSVKNSQFSYADSGFSFVPHEVKEERMEIWEKEEYVEAPVPIYNMENIAMVKDEENITAFFLEGIKEYEVLEDKMALTLYRGIGLLGRDNLVWRPNRASGINNTVVYTPHSQILQELNFNYAVYMDEISADTRENLEPQLFSSMEKFIKKSVGYQKQSLNSLEERVERFAIPHLKKSLPHETSLFKIDNPEMFMSCCKKEYGKGKDYIVRLFNPSQTQKEFKIQGETLEMAELTNLEEVVIESGENILGSFSFKIEPCDYITLKLKIGKLGE